MLLSSEYNKLAWQIRRRYGVSLKWAMKSAYCLREMGIDKPERWLTKPSSPLAHDWEPSNVMKLVSVIRSQARQAESITRREELNSVADKLYSRYTSSLGIGCDYASQFLDGELVYWATKYYVESWRGATMGWREESNYLAIEFSEGDSYTTFWYDYAAS